MPSAQTRHTESSILTSYLLPPSPLPTILPYSSFLSLVPQSHRSNPTLRRLYRDLQFQRTIDIDQVLKNIAREVNRSATLKGKLAKAVEAEVTGHSTSSEATNRKRKRGSSVGNKENHGHQSADEVDDDEFTNPQNLAIDTTYYLSTMHPSHSDAKSMNTHPLTAATQSQSQTHHTTTSLLDTLSTSINDIDAEIQDLESESARLMVEMNEIVGGLSDLRYGRFARPVSNGDGGGIVDGDRTVEDEVLEALDGLKGRLEMGL